jgi:hypothetical protein
VAGEGECIRTLGTLNTSVGVNNYTFNAINTGVAATTGIDGVIHVRDMWYAVGSGQQKVPSRPWEWFGLFHLNNPVPINGAPRIWSQFAQGASPDGGSGTQSPASGFGGTFYIDPPPDTTYTLLLDCVCYPLALVNDTTVEAIPYFWTDAVPFYAAWYALLSSQTNARRQDAEAYFGYYQQFVQRARQFANPSVNRYQYEQAMDAAQINKIGLPKLSNGGGGQ